MSTYADPNKANVWLDGDAFRAPSGTPMPVDPFNPTEAEGWLPFGGIEAGFTTSSEQSVTKKKVWNYRQASYKVTRDPLDEGVTFRMVDNSEAALLTRAQGGTITTVAGRDSIKKGDGENFALIVVLRDGDEDAVLYWSDGTLSGPVTRAAIDGQNIDGFDVPYTGLTTMEEIIPADSIPDPGV